MSVDETLMCSFQILKPSEKKAKYQYGGMNTGRPVTPPRTAAQTTGLANPGSTGMIGGGGVGASNNMMNNMASGGANSNGNNQMSAANAAAKAKKQ